MATNPNATVDVAEIIAPGVKDEEGALALLHFMNFALFGQSPTKDFKGANIYGMDANALYQQALSKITDSTVAKLSKAGLIVNPDSNNSSALFSVAKDSNGATLLQASNGSGSSVYDIALCPFGGDVLFGTTNDSATAGTGTKIQNTNINSVTPATTNSATPWTIYSTGASAFRFYVGAGGQIYATSTSISAISDQRLKENIRDLDTGLSEILSLQPRRFDWKTGKGKDIEGDQGFIAQEFEQVFPEMVEEWKDPAPEGEDPYKSVRADLIPVLVKAIQEQQAIINGLEARLAALEAN